MGAALAEFEEKLPGMAEHLEFDDDATVSLSPGDTYVQNGTRHRWSNPGTVPRSSPSSSSAPITTR